MNSDVISETEHIVSPVKVENGSPYYLWRCMNLDCSTDQFVGRRSDTPWLGEIWSYDRCPKCQCSTKVLAGTTDAKGFHPK